MIILRSGLVGCLAAYMLPGSVIHDPRDKIESHKAVLRFRSNQISEVTGIPFKKVKVHKAIYTTENGFINWNPAIANWYSKKVSGGIFDRSINNTQSVDRWVAPHDFHSLLIDGLKGRIDKVELADSLSLANTVPIISTVPMGDLLNTMSINQSRGTRPVYTPIYVSTFEIENCDVHQTIYYPELHLNMYRATLEGTKLTIESIQPINDVDVYLVIDSFGIEPPKNYVMNQIQYFGKMSAPLSADFDDNRLSTILMLTEKFNIYSLGRTATQRNILMDDCFDDIKKIHHMIVTPKYKRNLGIKP